MRPVQINWPGKNTLRTTFLRSAFNREYSKNLCPRKCLDTEMKRNFRICPMDANEQLPRSLWCLLLMMYWEYRVGYVTDATIQG